MTAHAERRRERASPAPPSNGAVRLHIDRLVLHGVAPVEAGRLARALEAEFALLATQPAADFASAEVARLPAARITAGPTPEQTGRAAAGAVWSGITSAGQGSSR